MSILEGFENRETEAEGRSAYYPNDVEQLLAYARQLESRNNELVAMLRKHEFHGNGGGDVGLCPECRCNHDYLMLKTGHAPDCQLAKLIGGVD